MRAGFSCSPHPHTTTLAWMIDRSQMASADKAYFTWLAWVHWSSRSGANFFHLMTR